LSTEDTEIIGRVESLAKRKGWTMGADGIHVESLVDNCADTGGFDAKRD
jgi:hypothetical protein